VQGQRTWHWLYVGAHGAALLHGAAEGDHALPRPQLHRCNHRKHPSKAEVNLALAGWRFVLWALMWIRGSSQQYQGMLVAYNQ
jgi:hypothetical protein